MYMYIILHVCTSIGSKEDKCDYTTHDEIEMTKNPGYGVIQYNDVPIPFYNNIGMETRMGPVTTRGHPNTEDMYRPV